METNNFAFEVKVILGLKSTIPDGRPAACWTEKLGIEPATAQLELGLGLSFAKMMRGSGEEKNWKRNCSVWRGRKEHNWKLRGRERKRLGREMTEREESIF